MQSSEVKIEIILAQHAESLLSVARDVRLKLSSLKFAVIGEGSELGRWGRSVPFLLQETTVEGDGREPIVEWRGNININTFTDSFEYRFVIWSLETQRIVGVDVFSSLPRLVSLGNLSGHRTRVKTVRCDSNDVHFISSCDLRSVPLTSQGPFLHLNLFPHDCSVPFSSQWKENLSKEAQEIANRQNTSSLIRIKSVDVVNATYCGPWQRCFAQSGICLQATTAQPLLKSKQNAILEPLSWVPPLQNVADAAVNGINEEKSMEYWTVTFDLSHMNHCVPSISFETVPDLQGTVHEGTTALFPEMLTHTSGVIVLPVITSDKTFLGSISVVYLLVTPFQSPLNNFRIVRTSSRQELQVRTFVGHRGLGKTYTEGKASGTKLAENSLESMLAAHARGCPFVEFDVMLTSDDIPVIFHDGMLEVKTKGRSRSRSMRRFSSIAVTSDDLGSNSLAITSYENIPVGVHQLTRRQLEMLVTDAWQKKHNVLRDLIRKHMHRIRRIYAAKYANHTDPEWWSRVSKKGKQVLPSHSISNRILSLEEFFEELPPTVGFDLEVKFPAQPKGDAMLYLQTQHFEINKFVDRILAIVFRYIHQGRKIVFSCFDPDVCIALMQKQSVYDVLFLCDGEDADYKDYRCLGAEGGIQFGSAQKLAGISLSSASLLEPHQKALPRRTGAQLDRQMAKSEVVYTDGERAVLRWKEARAVYYSSGRLDSVADLDSTAPQFAFGKSISSCVHNLGMVLWTWGAENEDHYWCMVQREELKIDAVITDNIPHWETHQENSKEQQEAVGGIST